MKIWDINIEVPLSQRNSLLILLLLGNLLKITLKKYDFGDFE